MSSNFTRVFQHFLSLEVCLEHIKANFDPAQTIRINSGRDIHSGEAISFDVPAYLYRGESYPYPTTTPSGYRLNKDRSLPKVVRDSVQDIIRRLDLELQDWMHFNPMYSAGFLQHYGAPTQFLDVTSSLDVAAYFASGGKIGGIGLICVFPVEHVSGKAITVDLTNHPGAERARRQSAFAFYHRTHTDLKSATCINDLKLKWFSFSLMANDISLYHGRNNLVDAHTDRVAGVLQIILDGWPKMDDRVAKWLSEHIVPAPFVTKALDWYGPNQPRTVELVPMSDASIAYDEEQERWKNYRKWSIAFDEELPHRLILQLGDLLRKICPSEQILCRFDPNWPAGNCLDFLIPGRKLAFLYEDMEPDQASARNTIAAEEWCRSSGYRLIPIVGPGNVTEKRIRRVFRNVNAATQSKPCAG